MNTAAMPKTSTLTLALRVLGVVLVLTLAAAAVWPLLHSGAGLPVVSRLEIDGALRAPAAERLRIALAPMLQGPLLDLDMDALRQTAEREPWVAQVRVERRWPDAVRVSVIERHPVARWGSDSLLTAEGLVFSPAAEEWPADLVQLQGPEGRGPDVLQTFRDLSEQLRGTGFAPMTLIWGARGEWTARTASGMELRLGRGDPRVAAALLQGVAAHTLAAREAEIAYVDLRYTNGFAVGWRNGAFTDALRHTTPEGAGGNDGQ